MEKNDRLCTECEFRRDGREDACGHPSVRNPVNGQAWMSCWLLRNNCTSSNDRCDGYTLTVNGKAYQID